MASRKDIDFTPDKIIQELMKDVRKGAPDTTLMTGLLGESEEPECCRLYTSLELTDYFDIPKDDVVASKKIDTKDALLGGTMLFVRSSAELKHVRTSKMEARASFLSGGVVEEGATAAVPASALVGIGGAGVKGKYTDGFWCGVSLVFACATHVVTNSVCHLASGKVCVPPIAAPSLPSN